MTDKGKVDKAVGKVQETAGDITSNDKLKGKGLLKQAEGKVKEVSSEIKEKTEEIVDDVKDKFKEHDDKK
ncbi:CsbD family protein [Vagococcus luciliae]|uniref:CsbD family protein n=1 Tax=Vagococcus luciliae TaxID=2920380 RepID=A0ABY5NXV6_9ENTE|nr:CsbD family protein [Vagococcus luciliae]UUV98323.1 hypothetical protein G314FT_04390 [Vagococcus luciliae]